MFLAKSCLGEGPWLAGCGNVCIPADLANITTLLYNAIRIIVPIVLVISGMFLMAKAITQKSQDEVKKAQQLLARRAVAAAIVFLLFSLITWMLALLGGTGEGNETDNVISCLNSLFNYNESVKTKTGTSTGVSDISYQCKLYNYDGAFQIYSPTSQGSNNYTYKGYVCYKYNSNDSLCDEGINTGTKYTFADGHQYCVGRLDENNPQAGKVATLGTRTYENPCLTSTTEESCQACCAHINYFNYILSSGADGKEKSCTCANLRGN